MTSSDWLPTACILCECNCGIVVQVDDRRLARIRGDKAHPGSAATPATRRCGWTITRTTGLA
ncbi:Possible oxidoreductase [Mycobacterium tuberculosis]|nr:Possible oxidoreductase [Mycobacterium tuberculosis]